MSDRRAGASRARFLQVRGVGDLEQFLDPKHFPAVGIRIDDIDLGSAANAAMLFDREQVEFLRGPQGTGFGTSALAGLVNIRGRRPSDAFEGYARIGIGNYGSWHAGAAVSGPLGEAAKGRLAVLRNTGDGYIANTHPGRDDTNGYDETSVRATLEFDPNDRSHYGVTALYFDGRNGYDAFSLDNTRDTLADRPGHDNQKTLALGRAGPMASGPDDNPGSGGDASGQRSGIRLRRGLDLRGHLRRHAALLPLFQYRQLPAGPRRDILRRAPAGRTRKPRPVRARRLRAEPGRGPASGILR